MSFKLVSLLCSNRCTNRMQFLYSNYLCTNNWNTYVDSKVVFNLFSNISDLPKLHKLKFPIAQEESYVEKPGSKNSTWGNAGKHKNY